MNLWLFVGAVNGFLAVAAGAFGAHGLQGRIDAKALEVFNTGAHYHLIHALATAAVALALTANGTAQVAGPLRTACALFTLGTALFSGSLYFYAMTGSASLVLATPIGGLAFLAGWAALAWGAFKMPG